MPYRFYGGLAERLTFLHWVAQSFPGAIVSFETSWPASEAHILSLAGQKHVDIFDSRPIGSYGLRCSHRVGLCHTIDRTSHAIMVGSFRTIFVRGSMMLEQDLKKTNSDSIDLSGRSTVKR